MSERYYRYLDAEGAIASLENGTLRFSKPTKFNDPFDVNLQLLIPERLDAFLEDVKSSYHEFIRNIDASKIGHPYKRAYIDMLQIRLSSSSDDKEKKIAKEWEQWEPIALAHLWDVSSLEEIIDKMRVMLQEFFQGIGVVCLSSCHENLLLWSHYAKGHTGAALEFTPSPTTSGEPIFESVMEINYSSTRPLIHETVAVFMSSFYTPDPSKLRREFIKRFIFTKSLAWKYEKEYRIAIPREFTEGSDTFDFNFHTPDLTAVYLGCKMAEDDKDNVTKNAIGLNSNVKIFQMTESTSKYELLSNKI